MVVRVCFTNNSKVVEFHLLNVAHPEGPCERDGSLAQLIKQYLVLLFNLCLKIAERFLEDIAPDLERFKPIGLALLRLGLEFGELSTPVSLLVKQGS